MSNIHPTAIIGKRVKIDASARIGPFCIIEDGADIGPGCILDSHVRVYSQVCMGANNRIGHGAAIGAEPQDLGYTPERARPLRIGEGNHFRENVVISSGVKETHGTLIGNHNYFMNAAHVGHDCVIGDHNIFGTNVAIGGHVEIADHTFLSGMVAVHQFCHIGSYVMVGGVSGVRQDIPPYCLANGQYARFIGLNLVGLRRNGFDQTQRNNIKQAYRLLFRRGQNKEWVLAELRARTDAPELRLIVEFLEKSGRGLIRTD